LIILAVLAGCAMSTGSIKPPDVEVNAILDSADSLFKLLKAKEYMRIWVYLSVKSKNEIVNDTYKAIRKYNASTGVTVEYPKESIEKDFQSGGDVARSYWDGYLASFNPDMVLEQSSWEMGVVGDNKAEILVLYRRSEMPARIQMLKEGGQWKVGLVETFKNSMR
jgi:hypothetical protein